MEMRARNRRWDDGITRRSTSRNEASGNGVQECSGRDLAPRHADNPPSGSLDEKPFQNSGGFKYFKNYMSWTAYSFKPITPHESW